MKCIAYVSKAPISERGIRLPTGLSDVVRVARKYNPKSQITGIISYRQGQYFQVLEGPYREIEALMARISADPRHEDLWVFLNVRVTKRSFESWGVSVFDFVDQGPFFKTFIEDNRHTLNAFDLEQKQRIKPFIDLENIDVEPDYNYEGKRLRLLAWPDLNRLSQPQLVMSLCVKLTKKPYPFDKLVASGEFGDREQVTQIIKEFEIMRILTVIESEPESKPLQADTVIPTKAPNRFYGAVKRFLGMG